jgi:hypothetical protein
MLFIKHRVGEDGGVEGCRTVRSIGRVQPPHESRSMTVVPATAQSATIALLNDQARQSFLDCRVHITRGISSLTPSMVQQVLGAVRAFNRFDAGNDPYGEHDFGKVAVAGHDVFWRFDYYDLDLQMASLDPADPTITCRVLTIMLAEEY